MSSKRLAPVAPAFILKPNDREVQVGARVLFTCTLQGQPQPTVVWYKDNQPISSDGQFIVRTTDSSTTLTIKSASEQLAGMYTCEASNPAGTARTVLQLRVAKSASALLDQPKASSSQRSSRSSSPVSVDSMEPCRTNSSLLRPITETTTNSASDRVGTPTAGLRVPSLPGSTAAAGPKKTNCDKLVFIREMPAELHLSRGSRLSLCVEMKQFPGMTAVWYLNNAILVSDRLGRCLVKTGTKFELLKERVDLTDQGVYTCVISCYGSSVTSRCCVTVESDDSADAASKDAAHLIKVSNAATRKSSSDQVDGTPYPKQTVAAGITAHSPVKGGTPAVVGDYDSRSNDPGLGPDRPVEVLLPSQPAKSSSVPLHLPEGLHLGIESAITLRVDEPLVLKVDLSKGQGIGPVRLTLPMTADLSAQSRRPSITRELPAQVEAINGDDIRLAVGTKNVLPHDCWWTVDGERISLDDGYSIGCQGNIFLLEVTSAGVRDSGLYGFHVRSGESVISTETELVVRPAESIPPSLISGLEKRYTFLTGTTALLSVEFASAESCQVRWMRNGEPLSSADRRYSLQLQESVCTLQISDLVPTDSGEYQVEIINTAGQVSSSTALQVQPAAMGVGVNSAQLTPNSAVLRKGSLVQPKAVPVHAPAFGGQHQAMQKSLSFQSRNTQPPVVLVPLVTTRALFGQDINLLVSAKGQPQPRATWLKDGKLLAMSNRLSAFEQGHNYCLSVRSVVSTDAGTYSCVLENVCGKAETSTQVILQKYPTKPRISQRLQPIGAFAGEMARFMAVLKETDGVSTTWYHNSLKIVPGPRYNLVTVDGGTFILEISDLSADDSGEVEFVVQNEFGKDSSVATLSVSKAVSPPTLQPLTRLVQQARSGEDVLLKVTCTGQPMPVLSWMLSSCPLLPSAKYEIATSDLSTTLIVHGFQAQDAGKYSCSASNPAGCATVDFVIGYSGSVQDLSPKILTPISPKRCKEGGSLLLSVQFESKSPALVQWKRDGSLIQGNGRVAIVTDRNTSQLGISSLSLDDDGEYMVVVENGHGQVMQHVSVCVDEASRAPAFIQSPEPVEILEGQEAEFVARVSGIPEPQVEWHLNGNLLEDRGRFEIFKENEDTHVLIITKCLQADSGSILCVASNEVDEISSVATLQVLGGFIPPDFQSINEIPDKLVEGGDVKIELIVTGRPTPKVEWLHGDSVIGASLPRTCIYNKDNFHSLTITKVAPCDSGIYRCRAFNAAGMKIRTFTIIIQGSKTLSRPLSLIGLPETVSVHEGQPLKLEATIEGADNFDFRWYRNNQLLCSGPGITVGSRGHALFLFSETVESAHGGMYRISARRGEEEATAETTVRVLERLSQPVFKQVLKDCRVAFGESAELCVEVQGNPQPTLRWLVNHLPPTPAQDYLSSFQDGVGVLRLTRCTPELTGPVTCIAVNDLGQVSCSAALTVTEPCTPPRVQSESTSSMVSAEAGNPQQLAFRVSGNPTPDCTWKRNGMPFVPGPGVNVEQSGDYHSLSFTKIAPSDGGLYQLTATNTVGSDSSSVQVIVGEPTIDRNQTSAPTKHTGGVAAAVVQKKKQPLVLPEFTLKPRSRSLPAGSLLKLTCGVFCSKPVVVEWYRNEVLVVPNDNISTSCSGTLHNLVIQETGTKDAGTYKVVARAADGEVSAEAQIHVTGVEKVHPKTQLPPPKMSSSLPNVSADVSQSVTLEVPFVSDAPVKVVWFKDGDVVQSSDRIKIKSGTSSTTLVISNCQPPDAGLYKVKVEGDQGSSSCDVRLDVCREPEVPPGFSKSLPNELVIMEDDKLQLEICVTGHPPPSVTWLKDGTQVPLGKHTSSGSNGPVHCLIIEKAGLDDEGLYTCVAKNSMGTASSEIEVYVDEREVDLAASEPSVEDVSGSPVKAADQPVNTGSMPVFKLHLQNRSVEEFSVVRLDARIEASPAPEVTWLFDDIPITSLAFSEVKLMNDGDLYSLLITEATSDNTGVYMCIAKNPHGRAESSCQLYIEGSPADDSLLRKISKFRKSTGMASVESVLNLPTYTVTEDFPASKEASDGVLKVATGETVEVLEMDDNRLWLVRLVENRAHIGFVSADVLKRYPPEPSAEAPKQKKVRSEGVLKDECSGAARESLEWFFKSEQAYCLALKAVFKNHFVELKEEDLPECISVHGAVMFGNWPQLLDFHDGTFLCRLDDAMDASSAVLNTLLASGHQFLSLYSMYAFNYPTAEALIKVPEVAEFWKEFDEDVGLSSPTEDFLMLPLKRIELITQQVESLVPLLSNLPQIASKVEETLSMYRVLNQHTKACQILGCVRELDPDRFEIFSKTVFLQVDTTFWLGPTAVLGTGGVVMLLANYLLALEAVDLHRELGSYILCAELEMKSFSKVVVTKSKLMWTCMFGGSRSLSVQCSSMSVVDEWLRRIEEVCPTGSLLVEDGDLRKEPLSAEEADSVLEDLESPVGAVIPAEPIPLPTIIQEEPKESVPAEPPPTSASEGPRIVQSFSDVLVMVGAKARLEVKYDPPHEVETQWFINGNPVEENRNHKVFHEDDCVVALVIRNVTEEDIGSYLVVLTDDSGSSECRGRILLSAPPKISCPFRDCSAKTGSNLQLSAQYEGSPPLTTRWYHGDREISSTDALCTITTSSSTSVLCVPTVNLSHAGTYKMTLTNEHGEASCSAVVKIGDAPPAPVEPSTSVQGKTNVRVSWVSPPGGEGVKYSVEMLCVKGNTEHWKTVVTHISDTCYVVKNLDVNEKYQFRVWSANSFGESPVSAPSPVIHLAGEQLVQPPKDSSSSDSSEPVKSPGPTSRPRGNRAKHRYHGGSSDDDQECADNAMPVGKQKKSGDKHQTQNKLSPALGSAKEFRCLTASRPLGPKDSVTFGPPEFVKELEDSFIMEHNAARFECCVHGNPPPTIEWYKDGELIRESPQYSMLYTEEDHCILIITKGNYDTAGKFSCVAKNTEGSVTSSATLYVEGLTTEYETDSEDDVSEEEKPSVEPVIPKTCEVEKFYTVKEELGRGKFGVVSRCIEKSTGKDFAAKFIKCRPSEKHVVHNEIAVMNQLHHRRLISLHDVYESARSIVLVLELVTGGELFEKLTEEEFISEMDVTFYMKQVLEGIRYMHAKNILHLDLKPENIMIVRPGSRDIKLIDFGLARKFNPAENLKVLFGTPEFVAPEVINYDKITKATDMWSIGVITYVLLSGLSPFMGDNDSETLSNVTRALWDFDDPVFQEISYEAKDFISCLLIKEPRERSTCQACLEHPWFKVVKRLRKKLNTERLRQFHVRRKWKKAITAVRSTNFLSRLLAGMRTSVENSGAQEDTARAQSSLPGWKKASIEDDSTDHTAPAFIKKLIDSVCLVGESIELVAETSVELSPKTLVTWKKEGKIIEPTTHLTSSVVGGKAFLAISRSQYSDCGRYSVRVENQNGSVESSCQLIVKGSPDPPLQPKCPYTSASTAIVQWQPSFDGNSPITHYIVHMQPQNDSEWLVVHDNFTECVALLEDLEPNTSYRFRVAAHNSCGLSQPSIPSELATTLDKGKVEQIRLPGLRRISRSKSYDLAMNTKFKLVSTVPTDLDSVRLKEENPETHYNLGEEIGRGKFAVVKSCIRRSNNEEYAAKMVKYDEDSEELFRNEFEIWTQLSCDQLCTLVDAYLVRKYYVFICELIPGTTLLDYLASLTRLTEEDVVSVLTQLLEALRYLHRRDIVHLDIKPSNIIISDGNLKLVDYGCCRVVKRKEGERGEMVGTAEFTAPEMIKFEPITCAADMWSVGVLTYIMLSGISPFACEDEDETLLSITSLDYRFEASTFASITERAKSFIKQLIVIEPEARPGAAECLRHDWFEDIYRARRTASVIPTASLRQLSDELAEQERMEAIRASLTLRTFLQSPYQSPDTSSESELFSDHR